MQQCKCPMGWSTCPWVKASDILKCPLYHLNVPMGNMLHVPQPTPVCPWVVHYIPMDLHIMPMGNMLHVPLTIPMCPWTRALSDTLYVQWTIQYAHGSHATCPMSKPNMPMGKCKQQSKGPMDHSILPMG